jgi:hypothetical protein
LFRVAQGAGARLLRVRLVTLRVGGRANGGRLEWGTGIDEEFE